MGKKAAALLCVAGVFFILLSFTMFWFGYTRQIPESLSEEKAAGEIARAEVAGAVLEVEKTIYFVGSAIGIMVGTAVGGFGFYLWAFRKA